MRTLLFFICLVSVSFGSMNAQSLRPKDEAAIKKALFDQQDAWNEGDITAFMQGYWDSDSLTFVSKSGVTYSWTATRDRYFRNYPDRSYMGTLDFTIVRLAPLGKKAALMIGQWHLTREKGDVGGYFTLIWQKRKGKWVIVSDHTS